MVGPFLARYPEIELEIVSESSLIDIVREGFDAGIRYQETLAQDMIAVPLGAQERTVLVAAPALVRARPPLRHPKALADAPCIATRFRSGMLLPWEFRKGRARVRILPSGPLAASMIDVQLAAALQGIGYLKMLEGYVAADIAAGRLVPQLADWCPYEPGPFLYYPGRRHPPPALAAFVAFVRQWRATHA
jgi:DNA-binding transcriptional LysR family regulator